MQEMLRQGKCSALVANNVFRFCPVDSVSSSIVDGALSDEAADVSSPVPLVGKRIAWSRVAAAIGRVRGSELSKVAHDDFVRAVENEGLRNLLSRGVASVGGDDENALSDEELDRALKRMCKD